MFGELPEGLVIVSLSGDSVAELTAEDDDTSAYCVLPFALGLFLDDSGGLFEEQSRGSHFAPFESVPRKASRELQGLDYVVEFVGNNSGVPVSQSLNREVIENS